MAPTPHGKLEAVLVRVSDHSDDIVHRSIRLIVYQEGVATLWVLAMAVVMGRRVLAMRTGRTSQPRGVGSQRIRSPAATAFFALAVGIFAVVFSRTFLFDAFAARRPVEGSVERLGVKQGLRGIWVRRYVVVNGQQIEVAADTFARLRPGDRIRGKIGAGSGILLDVEP